jgi:RNA polymerase sigma factor (sigma-70 family)
LTTSRVDFGCFLRNIGLMVDERQYFQLYKSCRQEFLRWSTFSYNLSQEDARDLYQETFLRIWSNLHTGKLSTFSCTPKSYVFSVGKHVILDHIEKHRRSVVTPHEELKEEGVDHLQESHDALHTVHIIQEGLKKLELRERKIIELFYFNKMDMHSIAKELGYKNADVAKKRKYEVFRKLCEIVNKTLSAEVLQTNDNTSR